MQLATSGSAETSSSSSSTGEGPREDGPIEFTIKAGEDFEALCLHKVRPGDSCYLEKGDYEHDGLTITHGEKDNRITIHGHSEACIKGSNTQDRVLQIAHDYYTVEDICFDGDHGSGVDVATAIYVLGGDRKTEKEGVTASVVGFQMFNLEIKVTLVPLRSTFLRFFWCKLCLA